MLVKEAPVIASGSEYQGKSKIVIAIIMQQFISIITDIIYLYIYISIIISMA